MYYTTKLELFEGKKELHSDLSTEFLMTRVDEALKQNAKTVTFKAPNGDSIKLLIGDHRMM